MRYAGVLLLALAACEKIKPPPDPLLAGAVKVQSWSELEKNAGKKVTVSGKASNVNGRAAIEIAGGVVYVGMTSEWDDKMVRQSLTGVGTLVREDPADPKDKPTYSLHDFQSRGMGLR